LQSVDSMLTSKYGSNCPVYPESSRGEPGRGKQDRGKYHPKGVPAGDRRGRSLGAGARVWMSRGRPAARSRGDCRLSRAQSRGQHCGRACLPAPLALSDAEGPATLALTLQGLVLLVPSLAEESAAHVTLEPRPQPAGSRLADLWRDCLCSARLQPGTFALDAANRPGKPRFRRQ
jgi:hypothetical protein